MPTRKSPIPAVRGSIGVGRFHPFLLIHLQNGHDGVVGQIHQGVPNGFVRNLLLTGVRIVKPRQGLKPGELVPQPDTGHSQPLLYKGLMEAVAVVVVLPFVQAVQLVADRLMAHHFFVHWFIPPE